MVKFNLEGIETKAGPYWLVQEIGTGGSATIVNPELGTITIPSQVGRRIPSFLDWGSGTTKDNAGNGLDQLYIIQGSRRSKMRIHKEIEGKHYLRIGGFTGFETLREGLTDAIKETFGEG